MGSLAGQIRDNREASIAVIGVPDRGGDAMLHLVHDPELAQLYGIEWSELDPRAAQSLVEQLGWTFHDQGDWAYVYRSPSGQRAARVSPCELAYSYFVELCRRCRGSRHLPRIDLATSLEGGGHLTVLEFLEPASPAAANDLLTRWSRGGGMRSRDADRDLLALRAVVDELDRLGNDEVRWWDSVDLGARHVLQSHDGRPKIIDIFCVAYNVMLDELTNDPETFATHLPPSRCRYLLDIPDLQRQDNSAGELARIRNALTIVARGSCT